MKEASYTVEAGGGGCRLHYDMGHTGASVQQFLYP